MPSEVDKERGVVIEEWRGRLGAGSRIRDKQIPGPLLQVALRGAPADRQAGDHPQRAGGAAARVLRHVVSARADGDHRRRRHRRRRSSRRRSARRSVRSRRARRPPQPPGRERAAPPRDAASTSPPTPRSPARRCSSCASAPKDSDQLVGDYRRSLVENLFTRMFNDRFGELARKPDAKFLGAGGGSDSLSPTVDTFGLSARVADGGLAAGLTALEIEARRVAAVRLHRVRARSREAMDDRVLRARLQRARQERERLVRAGIPELLPERRAEPRHRLRVPARAAGAAGHHARRRHRAGAVAAAGDEQRGAGRDAAEGRRRACRPRPICRPRSARATSVAVTPWSDGTTTRALLEKTAGAGARRVAPRAARHRRHRREVRQRRRSLAEADRLQERPGAVHDVRAGRRVARARATTSCRRASRRSTSACPGWAASRRSISTSCWPASWRPRRRSSAIDARHLRARRRRPISKPRCSCSIRTSPRRATIRTRWR